MLKERSWRIVGMVVSLAWGAGCGTTHDSAPPAPTGVSAAPANGQAVVTWNASAGATSYSVYYAASGPVTAASPKIAATGTSAVVPGLTNGARYLFAVSASNDGGESPLSGVACAVPTAASTAGLTLYDALCGDALDGQRWHQPGAYAIAVSGGSAVLSVDAVNEESRTIRNNVYSALVGVNAGTQRVSTLRANVTVPSATAARTGGVQIRAVIRLLYSPPSKRLVFPLANLDVLLAEVGLIDTGNGLQAFRQVTHCDDAPCVNTSAANVAFTDPVTFAPIGAGLQAGAPAAYDTTYTASVSLDEGTGVFHWTIAGGAFGAGVSGSADPSAYLAGTPDWTGIPLAGSGFQVAQMGVRTSDASSGGGSGRIAARFGNVWVGFNGAAAAPYDDFGGAAGNSAAPELSAAKWTNAGTSSVGLSGGSLALQGQLTGMGSATSTAPGVFLSSPASYNTVQADVSVVSYATASPGSANAFVQGRFYNDGTAGGGPGSALGDILGGVFMYPATNTASYMIGRCANATCSGALSSTLVGSFTGVNVTAGVHALFVKWDPALHLFTFRVDGNTLMVDPTASFAVAGPANAPFRRVMASLSVPSAGAFASEHVKVNNVFVAP